MQDSIYSGSRIYPGTPEHARDLSYARVTKLVYTLPGAVYMLDREVKLNLGRRQTDYSFNMASSSERFDCPYDGCSRNYTRYHDLKRHWIKLHKASKVRSNSQSYCLETRNHSCVPNVDTHSQGMTHLRCTNLSSMVFGEQRREDSSAHM